MTTTPHSQWPELQAWAAALRSPVGLVVLLVLLLLPAAGVAQQPYRIGPPPSWVTPIKPDLAAPASDGTVTYGYELLLIDRQESVGAGRLERYRHMTYRLLNQAAVEDLSQVELSLDPTYEQLTLHSVNVIRDGQVINQLKPSQIRVAQRESSMDRHVFDGSVSVVLVLEGVRVGDLLEYSYTRTGANPVFAGHYFGYFTTQESVPVHDFRFRLLWPDSRQLQIHRYLTTTEPATASVAGRKEYLWAAKDLTPKLLDEDLPDWYDAFPSIRLSDFPSWKEVAAWGDTLFATPGPIPPLVKQHLASIRAANSDPESRALAALRYAQEEVRYLGVEIGANSHRPFPLATVIRRGYGDCKDKAQLLVAMLRDLEIPAWPALVSTSYGARLVNLQPTSVAFDHAIVLAEIDGQQLWLDPTDLYQRGDIQSVAAQYGAALVLGRGSDSLSLIPRVTVAEPLSEVRVEMDLGNIDKPVTMRIETDYRGRAAVNVRSSSRSNSLERLQKNYTGYYAASYPGIQPIATLTFEDNEATNVLHTSERYTIPKFWHMAADQSGYIGTFQPVEIAGVVPAPAAAGRTMPLAVDFPTHYRYTLIAHLNAGWGVEAKTDSLETPAMRFVRSVEAKERDLTLRYEYETLADHVDPDAATDHLEKLSQVRRLLAFSVLPPPSSENKAAGMEDEGINWPILMVGILAGVIMIVAAVLLARSGPPSWVRWPAPPIDGPSGLRGWLYLLGFGVCLTPLVALVGLFKMLPTYGISSWAAYTSVSGSHYHPLYGPLLILEMLFSIVLLVFSCLQIWFFFGRKRWFVVFFVVFMLIRLAYDVSDVMLANQIPSFHAKGVHWSRLLQSALAALIWVAYLLRSRRVRNTFVN